MQTEVDDTIFSTENGRIVSPSTATICVILFCHNQAGYLPDHARMLSELGGTIDQAILVDIASDIPVDPSMFGFDVDAPGRQFVRFDNNIGILAAMNRSLTLVETNFVHFLAADDCVSVEFYRAFKSLAGQFGTAGVFSTAYDLINELGHPGGRFKVNVPLDRPGILDPATVEEKLFRYDSWFAGHATIMNAEGLRRIGGFDPVLRGFSDAYAIHCLALRWGALFDPNVLATKRRHPGQAGVEIFGTKSRPLLDSVLAKMRLEAGGNVFNERLLSRIEGRWKFNEVVVTINNDGAGRGFHAALLRFLAFLRFKPFDLVAVVRKRLWRFAL